MTFDVWASGNEEGFLDGGGLKRTAQSLCPNDTTRLRPDDFAS